MDFEDPRLKNILKLKEAFEKELMKMGKLKPKPKKESTSASKLKINVEIAPSALVNAADTWTVIDLNRQDYDASDAAIAKALRKTIVKVGDIRQRTMVEGIIKLLEGDYEGAKEVFSRFDSEEYKYMLGVAKLYSGDPEVLKYAIDFLKKNPSSMYPYLLMSEIMIGLGRYQEAERFFEAAAKISKDVYINLVLGVYREDPAAGKLFPIAVNKRGYKALLAILSIFMEKDSEKAKKIAESISKRDHSCCRYISSYWGGTFKSEDAKKYPFCPRINVIRWARDFEAEKLDSDPRENAPWTDPLVDLFLGFYSMNVGEDDKAEEYFESFRSKVEIKKAYIFRSGKMVKKFGVRMFYEPMRPDPVLLFSDLSAKGIRQAFKEAMDMTKLGMEHLDVFVDFRDPDILRLFFGQRHCKHLYGD